VLRRQAASIIPFEPPSLSTLLRWVHANITGGTFDLPAVLELAAPYEAVSVALGRFQQLRSYLTEGYAERALRTLWEDYWSLHQLMETSCLEELSGGEWLAAVQKPFPIATQCAMQSGWRTQLTREKAQSRRAEGSQDLEQQVLEALQVSNSCTPRNPRCGLIRQDADNERAVRAVLEPMQSMPEFDAPPGASLQYKDACLARRRS
jgi:hypothetical protein